MKRSIVSGLFIVTLAQSLAQAQIMDLPDPGGDIGPAPSQGEKSQEAATSQDSAATEYAGSVRINGMSRKTGGTLYRLDLSQPSRLKRLDLRVAVSRVKLYEARLVTESGNKVDVMRFRDSSVLETSSVHSSENFSLNERIVMIEIVAESYSAEADIIMTAVADDGVPKLSLRREVAPPVPPPPAPPVTPTAPPKTDKPKSSEQVISYGNRFKAGQRAFYLNRDLVTVRMILGNGRVEVVFNDGYSEIVNESDLVLAVSVQCLSNLCRNDRILYDRRAPGRVNQIFNNGMVEVDLEYNGMVLTHIRYLAKMVAQPSQRTVECWGNLCLGDSIYYRGNPGRILEIYSNGLVRVKLTGYAREHVVNIRDLQAMGW